MKKKLLLLLVCLVTMTGCQNQSESSSSENQSDSTALEIDKSKIQINPSYESFNITPDEMLDLLLPYSQSETEFKETDANCLRIKLTDTLEAEIPKSDDVPSISFLMIESPDDKQSLANDVNTITEIFKNVDGYDGEMLTLAADRASKAVVSLGYGSGETVKNHLYLSVGIVPHDEGTMFLVVLKPTSYANEEEYSESTGKQLDKYDSYVSTDETATIDESFEKESNTTELKNGTFKVGVDLQPGEYKLTTENGSGYYAVHADSAGGKILNNENFETITYVTVLDGQYLELKRCKAEPLE